MKTINKIPAFLVIIFLAVGSISQKTWAQPNVGWSQDDFYNELSPYGDWMDYPSYGQVWRPRVDADFQPYATDGRWEMTEYGNTWVSDYPWGWAPFHYGRWLFDDSYGWIWIPGNEWGPAWVSWRSGGGYYGWAPLGPGMGIDININIPYNYWVFVPEIYIRNPRVYSYCVPRNRINNIFGGTAYINNYYRYNNRAYVYGPNRRDLERITRNRINVYRADDLHRNSRNNNYNRNNGGYYQGYSRNNNGGYNNRPDYNDRERWDNNRNRNGNDTPRYDNRNSQSQRNDRYDNNTNRERERNQQQPERTAPQPSTQADRPYQAPTRGDAERTWSGNRQSERNREQPAPRTNESRESAPRRTWSDNGNSNQQPRNNRDYAPQRSQEQPQQRNTERSNDNQNRPERRRRD